MARVEFDIETDVAPERVIAALTDFSERRPDLWPGLDRDQYEVYDVGATSALVREGNSERIWAKERYDWSTPGIVRWEVVESSFCEPGSFVETRVVPTGGGGSRIRVTWYRRPRGPLMWLMLGMIVVARGGPVKSSFREGLDRIAAQGAV